MLREVVRSQTWGQYHRRWIKERRIKESSRKEYTRLYETYIAEALDSVPIYALDAATVRSWFAGLDTTVHRKHKAYWHLNSVCVTAVADGLMSPNPCQLNVPKPDRIVKPVILEPQEVAAAADIIAGKYRALALIAAWCGLRWSELVELRRKDISDNAEIITAQRRFVHDGGCDIDLPKSNRGHTVVVPPHIRADIKHHLDTYVGTDAEALLLPGKAKGCGHIAPATFRGAWHKALKDSGCQRVRLHDLRHYAGDDRPHRGQSDRVDGPPGACQPGFGPDLPGCGCRTRRRDRGGAVGAGGRHGRHRRVIGSFLSPSGAGHTMTCPAFSPRSRLFAMCDPRQAGNRRTLEEFLLAGKPMDVS
jgi:integrase